MVCDLDTTCYVRWETIYTNHLPARPRSFTKTYKNIYTTTNNNISQRIRTYGRDGLACSVLIRIFTYKIRTIMNKFITYVEKYIQTPTLVIFSLYIVYHLIKAWLG